MASPENAQCVSGDAFLLCPGLCSCFAGVVLFIRAGRLCRLAARLHGPAGRMQGRGGGMENIKDIV